MDLPTSSIISTVSSFHNSSERHFRRPQIVKLKFQDREKSLASNLNTASLADAPAAVAGAMTQQRRDAPYSNTLLRRRLAHLLLIIKVLICGCGAYSPQSARDTSRREALTTAGGFLSAGSTWIARPDKSRAATPSTPSEAIRRSAANIPGYGQTDVFYPLSYEGKWEARREIVASDTMDPSKLPLTLSYGMRFRKSIDDTAVIADRGFNQASFEKSLNNQVRTYEWSESNPNDLRLVFDDGTSKEIKITKRATERTEDTVSSSEFQRVTTENTNGIPVISARRVLTKWKVVEDGAIEGIEIVYDVGGNLGDPLAATSAPTTPKVISKSRLRLQRIQ